MVHGWILSGQRLLRPGSRRQVCASMVGCGHLAHAGGLLSEIRHGAGEIHINVIFDLREPHWVHVNMQLTGKNPE